MRALVYPYDEDFEIFITYNRFSGDIEISEILSPIGWGLQYRKVETGYLIKTKLEEVNWELVDVLLLVDSMRTELNQSEIIKVAEETVRRGKCIVLNRSLPKELHLELLQMCEKENRKLIDIRSQNTWISTMEEQLKTIETPIVAVAGMGERCNKLEVQMSLKAYLGDLGYKVCAVSSRKNTELAEMHSFPSFMYEDGMNESMKIINFNHYIKKLEIDEKPDLFLIGIPGSVIPVSDKHPEHFGTFAFEVFAAIKCDMLIFCIHNNFYTDEYFKELNLLCRYRFQSEIDAFVIGNYAYDSFSLETEGKPKYLSFCNDEVVYSGNGYPPNVYYRLTYGQLAEHVVSTLSDYSDYQVM